MYIERVKYLLIYSMLILFRSFVVRGAVPSLLGPKKKSVHERQTRNSNKAELGTRTLVIKGP